MAIEKRWEAISPRLFTSDGSADGQVTIASTDGFKTKQTVILKNNTGANLALEVKRVVSETELLVGPPGKITDRADISTFTTTLSSTIEAPEQVRPAIPDKEFERAVYEEEPVIAKRTISVDKLGRPIDSVVGSDGKVRLATDTAVTVSGISVDLDALTPESRPDPDNVLIAGSEDGTKTGIKIAFTNNIVQNIMRAKDRLRKFIYTQVGSKYRLDRIEYSSATFPGVTANKNFSWLEFGTKNERLDEEFWTLT